MICEKLVGDLKRGRRKESKKVSWGIFWEVQGGVGSGATVKIGETWQRHGGFWVTMKNTVVVFLKYSSEKLEKRSLERKKN